MVIIPFSLFSQNRAFFYDIKNNGIKINIIEDYRTLVSGFSLFYEGGTASEPYNKKGIANIVKYLMFSRTQNLSTDEFMFFFFNIGGITDAVITKDYTLFYDVFPSFYIDSILWLELERIKGLNFNDEDFIRAKNLVLKELDGEISKPLFGINLKIDKLIYGKNSPYGVSCVGRKKDILNINMRDIKKYYNEIMIPKRLSVFLTGAYSINEGFYKTRIFLSKVKNKKYIVIKTPETEQFKSGTYTIPYDGYYYYAKVFKIKKPETLREYLLFNMFAEIFNLSLKGYIINGIPVFSQFDAKTVINKKGAFLKIVLYDKHKINIIKSIFLLNKIIKELRKKTVGNDDFDIVLNTFKSKILDDFQYKSKKMKIYANIYNILGKIYLENVLLKTINRINKYEIYRYAQKIFIPGENIEIKTK